MKNFGPHGISPSRRRDQKSAEYRPDIRIFRAQNGFVVVAFDDEGKHSIDVALQIEDVPRLVVKRLMDKTQSEAGNV